MDGSKPRRALLLWPILILLLLAVRAPAEDTARNPGAVNQPQAAIQKPAWKWTLDERLAKRFDPAAMEARVREKDAEQKAIRDRYQLTEDGDPLFKVDPQAKQPIDVVDGKRSPEIFLPYELFTYLLDRGLPADGLVDVEWKGRFDAQAAALGFGQDLWPRLEKAAGPFLELQGEAARLRLPQPKSFTEYKKDRTAIRWCRMRAQALASAKAEFGDEPFLRLLYEAVAPTVGTVYSFADSGPAELAVQARFGEGGCR
jgi:hypothetical protein